jgi:HEAT repeat protein
VNSVSSSKAGGEKKSDELGVIRDAMFQALDERSETLAGTSLIGLELLSRTHEEFDRPAIVAKSLEIASDESASPSCRLTALRLASLTSGEPGAGGGELAANTARTLAQTGETVLLRSAAIVTLGETGTAEDRELLETFTFSDNKQIAAAALMALKKMELRN